MKKTILLLCLVLGSAGAIGCGGPSTYKLAATPKAVGADGVLDATTHKEEHETKLVLNVKNLAPPARIAADTKFFVAWGRKDSAATWSRIGNVVYKEDDRGGVLKASFPELAFDFEVTAEKDDSVASPSPEVIFAQRVGQ